MLLWEIGEKFDRLVRLLIMIDPPRRIIDRVYSFTEAVPAYKNI